MQHEYQRSDRVADQLQRELSVLIRTSIKDPRIPDMLTIGSIDVSRDLGTAKIYFTVLDDSGRTSMDILNRAAGFLRRELSKIMNLRRVPELRFILDETLEKGVQLSSLIDKAVASDNHNAETDTDDTQAEDSAS